MPTRAGNYISATAAGIPSVRPKTAAAIVTDHNVTDRRDRVHLLSGAPNNLSYFDTPTRPSNRSGNRNGF